MAIAPGDILEIDAEAAIGHEQQGRRPALVVSVEALQSALGLAMVCAITTHGGRASGARNESRSAHPARAYSKGGRAAAPNADDRLQGA